MNFTYEQLQESGFTQDQIAEIEAGAKSGVRVSLYANPNYLAIQMRQIRYGLEAGLNVSAYADPKYDWFQMEEIRKGLISSLPISKYANPSISYDRMKQIRLGLCDNCDLSRFKKLEAGILKQLRLALKSNVKIVPYIQLGYDKDQLKEIRLALEKQIPIEEYLDKAYRGVAIYEISLGLEHGVDVTFYHDIHYCWQQMREIRLGLEHRIDVTKYTNYYYDYKQMREIRLGLEAGVDVSYYKSLMYTAGDMRRRRQALLVHRLPELYESIDDEAAKEDEEEKSPVHITLANMNTEAYIDVSKVPEDEIRTELLKALRRKQITVGVKYDVIERLIEGKEIRYNALVAASSLPVNGQDGYYDFFFRTRLSREPKIEADGSVNYRDAQWYEMVKEGQKLAVYHHATEGVNGKSVTGEDILSHRGKEQCIITGTGFSREKDGLTYVSGLDGVVTYSEVHDDEGNLSEIRIEVQKLLVVEDVTLATGDIHYDGNLLVRGNVRSGAGVYVTGDVCVCGYVEAAVIHAGKSVMLKQGMNASNDGEVIAGEDVHGAFFEAVKIEAGGTICADYYMNCELHAGRKIRAIGKKGSLVGGTAWAEEGVSVNNLGNQAGLATYLKLGALEKLKIEEAALSEKLITAREELDSFMKVLNDFQNKYSIQYCSTNELYIKVERAIYTTEQKLEQLKEKYKELETRQKRAVVVNAEIEQKLYENVTFEIDHIRWKNTRVLGRVRVEKLKKQISVFSMK